MLYAHQKASVAEEKVERIVEMIRSGDHSPGARSPGERKLAEQLQVGRTSVRKAIRRLETMGLLKSGHGLGTLLGDTNELTADVSRIITRP